MDWIRRQGDVHYELNYLTSEEVARQVAVCVSSRLELDEEGIGKPGGAYPVHSLFLDSEDLALYRKALNDNEHRWQLRIRYSEVGADRPAILEVKRRLADVVIRDHCEVNQNSLPELLAGQIPTLDRMHSHSATHRAALEQFVTLTARVGARPRLYVAYLRECYVDPEHPAVRVSLDRQIVCRIPSDDTPAIYTDHLRHLFRPYVLVELNYGHRFPDWFREMVEDLDLTACEADKYVEGLRPLGNWGRSGLEAFASKAPADA